MGRHGENIHKRSDGRWEARYIKCRDKDGKAVYGSVYGRSYDEAKQKRLMLLLPESIPVLTAQEKAIKEPKTTSLVYADVLTLWLQEKENTLKSSSLSKYRRLIEDHIKPDLGSMPVDQIDAICINAFLNEKLAKGRTDLRGGLSPSYVRAISIIIHASLDYAQKKELRKPLQEKIILFAGKKPGLEILSQEEQKQLEFHLQSRLTNEVTAAIYLALYAGMRIGEICALKWEDVDLEWKRITVNHTVARIDNHYGKGTRLVLTSPKTRSSRRCIPMVSVLYNILSDIKMKAESEYVVSKSAHSFLSPRTLTYAYSRILEEAGIRHINFHALRHTFATRCVESGMDVKSLSEILGHGSVAVTLDVYVHSSNERKKVQLEKMAEMIKGQVDGHGSKEIYENIEGN